MATKTVNIDVQVQTKSLQDLEQELEEINAQLKQVPVGSEAFQELATQAQQVTKELNGVNAEVEGFTLEKKVRASQGAVTALAGGLEATVGSLGLIGIESEVFGEFEEKAISAIAAGRGFIDIADGAAIMAENINLATIKSKIFGITTKQAIIATGIGAFVVALGVVVANFDKINKGVSNFINQSEGLSRVVDTVKKGFDTLLDTFRPVLEFFNILPDAAERANKQAIKTNDELITSLEREIKVAEASGKSAEEIYNLKLQLTNAELDNLKRNEADKEEIYEKETELLALTAAEQKRVSDERIAEQQKLTEEEKAESERRIQQAEEEAKRKEEAEKNRVKSIEDILLSFREKERDIQAETELEKINLEEERKLAELERLKATEEQKDEIRLFYENRRKELEAEEEELLEEKRKEDREKELENIAELEQQKTDLRKQSLQNLSELFGQETALGRAALVAKQAILAQELIINARSTLGLAKKAATDATIEGASASTAIARGTAETAKVGFPQNVPLLIAYAAQAAGIIGAVRSAVGKTKAVASGLGGGVGGSVSAPSLGTVTAPSQQNIQQQPPQISPPTVNRTYVLTGDVTSGQEAEAKLNAKRTLLRRIKNRAL